MTSSSRGFLRSRFGGILGKRNGLNVRQRKRGAGAAYLYSNRPGQTLCVYLQSDERASTNEDERGLPTYSFTATAEG